MERILISEILKCTNGTLLKGDEKESINSISTDSRSLKAGDFFVAIKGKNFDGHEFVNKAAEAGANGILISEKPADIRAKTAVLVRDTGEALKNIAKYYLSKFKRIKVAGITGSNGKTTTKDITAECVSKKYKVLKAKGSFNNYIGMPLTIFEIDPSTQVAVLEYGTNTKGEIKSLTDIASPDISLITNIGRTHLEYFGTKEEILREKYSLIENTKINGTAILNADDDCLRTIINRIKDKRVVTFGIAAGADIKAADVQSLPEGGIGFILKAGNEEEQIKLPLIGMHNVYNALAGAAIARALNVGLRQIKEALENFKISSFHRLQKFVANGITVIDDAYNANPESVKEAINTLQKFGDNRKIAVLGDMAELGPNSPALHEEVGKKVYEAKINILLTLGEYGKGIMKGALEDGMAAHNVRHFDLFYPCFCL